MIFLLHGHILSNKPALRSYFVVNTIHFKKNDMWIFLNRKWSMGKYRTMLSYFLYDTKQHGHERKWEYLIFQRGLWGANIKQTLPTLLWPSALRYEYFLFECVDSTVAGLGYANIISCLVYSNLCEIKKYYLIKAYIL